MKKGHRKKRKRKQKRDCLENGCEKRCCSREREKENGYCYDLTFSFLKLKLSFEGFFHLKGGRRKEEDERGSAKGDEKREEGRERNHGKMKLKIKGLSRRKKRRKRRR